MNEINKNSITTRELFIYIATSLSVNPLLDGLEKNTRTEILKKVCKEMNLTSISNADIYQIFHTIELYRTDLGLALNKVLDTKSLDILRTEVLSKPDLIAQSMKMIQDNPDLITKIQKVLSEK